MHDVPYIQAKHFQPETVAVMSRVCTQIKHILPSNISCGVQVLACGNKEALAIAKACDLDFIRVEGFVFSHIADEGFTDANAGTLLRYRKQIDAENVLVFTDLKKKHSNSHCDFNRNICSSHSITADVSLVETAKAAEFFLSDGVILTGSSTGVAADPLELKSLKDNTNMPVLIGSGITLNNFKNYKDASAVIIGSYFKKAGLWSNDIDENIVIEFINKVKEFR
ncbi:hypothetical protein MML48_1g05204 [Holotrichia oblita]|uniref:Uncharacterized protein n=1 Tax=Holotrichia oblita TaxID=644536 RepID=A0ACB9TW93_HOLOL|nr:hypothetical protein MML48_1g05204 [Holotrichia oblita]